ncbi:hypothetical protein NIES22_52190 [Calothrix brevissima NIES-22]|nr:hypothetical protein NIES22_52190 [Calothrix brevissima NIES-22]
MVIPELEQQLLQLSPNKKLYIIQLLAQSLTIHNTHSEQPSKLSEFFRHSPLTEVAEELDLSRDRSLNYNYNDFAKNRGCNY